MFGINALLLVVIGLTQAQKYTEEIDNQKRNTEGSSRYCSSSSNCQDLFSRRKAFEVGHVQFIDVQGKRYRIVTRSLRPLMFEIPNFLSSSQCDHIVKIAEQKGLELSKTLADDAKPATPEIIDHQISRYKRIGKRFANYLDSVEKMTEFVNQAEAIYPRKADAKKMFKMFDVNKDNNITEEELFLAPDNVMQSFYNCLESYKSNPLYRSRYSTQTWLPIADNILHEIHDKIEKVTHLPKHIVENSEDLQVN